MISIIKRPEDLTEWERELITDNIHNGDVGLEVFRYNYSYDEQGYSEIDSIAFRETRLESQKLRKDLATGGERSGAGGSQSLPTSDESQSDSQ